MKNKRKTPVMEGLWIIPVEADEKPHLLGSKCSTCGEVYFPKKKNMTCTCCQSTTLTDIFLSTRGVVHTHTTVTLRPPGGYYKGKVPYAMGVVELPEGVYVQSLFTDCDFDKIKIGMPVELTIEKLYDDEENEVVTYKFGPISSAMEA